MGKVKFKGDIETVGLITDQVTISNPDGDAIVLDTEAWKKVKEVADTPYSFEYYFENLSALDRPYFDLDFNSIKGYNGTNTEINQHVVNNIWTSDEDGNYSGIMTFTEPLSTFPGLFYKYGIDTDYVGYADPVSRVTIPEGVKVLPRACFFNSSLMIDLPSSISYIADYALDGFYPMSDTIDFTNVIYFGESAVSPAPIRDEEGINLVIKSDTILKIGYQGLSGWISAIADVFNDQVYTPDDEGFIEMPYGGENYPFTYGGYVGTQGFGGAECVAAGTQILIDSIGNTKNVEDLKEGDIVLTKDGDSYIEATIDKVVIKTHFNYYILTLEDGTSVTISDDHAIMTADGWKSLYPIITEHPKDVNRLTEKDSVQTRNGLVKIKSIEHQHLTEEPLTMYNIGVSGYYNYFANNILVYECSGSE